MVDPAPQGIAAGELRGWKEISGYLNVAVRTAQLWEKQQNLPVKRLPGGGVYARTKDLDHWKQAKPEVEPLVNAALVATPSDRSRIYPVLLFVALGAFAVWWAVARPDLSDAPVTPIASHPLTATSELELSPALSPDGTRLAFVRMGAATQGSLLEGPIGSDVFKDVGPALAEISAPAWSPDGARVAYWKPSAGESVELAVYDLASRTSATIGEDSDVVRRRNMIDATLLSWTPDGRSLLTPKRSTREGPFSIHSVPVAGGPSEALTAPPDGIVGDSQPAIAPDGRLIAFVRNATFSESDLHVADTTTGVERRLTFENQRIWGLSWTPNGRAIIYSSQAGAGLAGLYWISPSENSPKAVRLTSPESRAQYPSVAAGPEGEALVAYQNRSGAADIWSGDLRTGDTRPLITSSYGDQYPRFSFDGSMITFLSYRTGFPEIWTATASGEAPKRLTSRQGPYSDMPRFSPDGSQVAFTSADENANRDIYVADVDGSGERRLTTAPSEEGRASWSNDGRYLYFRSDRSGRRQIWRRDLRTGEETRITDDDGYEALESPDGLWLYYVKSREEPELWRISPGGGRAEKVLDGVAEANWGLARDGVYFLRERTFYRLPYEGAAAEPVLTIPDDSEVMVGIAVSPDGATVLWAQLGAISSNIWLGRIETKSGR